MDRTEPIFLRNALVFDGSDKLCEGSAVLLHGSRIEEVGEEAKLRARAREVSAREIDLKGAFVMPGLVDAHMHAVGLGLSMLWVDLFECLSAAECVEKIAARAVELPEGEWVLAHGWRKSIWDVDAFPTARMIDAKVPDQPVMCTSFDGHCAWVNSKAMELAGITARTEEPAGGEILRQVSGRPVGIFKENAIALVQKVVPQPSEAERRSALLRAQRQLNELGVTGVHNLGGFKDYQLARRLAEEGELTIRFGACCRLEDEECTSAEVSPNPRDLVRLVAVKTFVDGSFNTQTAYMFEPYSGIGSCGIMTQSPEELRKSITRANELGLPVFVHAIGDRAVSEVLDALEEVGDPRLAHRIEHAACISKRDVRRMRRLGVAASVQPAHLLTDVEVCEKYLGKRSCRVYVFRDFLEAGVTLAFGSDAPVVSPDPREGIFAAVARRGLAGKPDGGWYPKQRLSVAEALTGFCRGSALSVGAGDVQGKVARGFEADLTVFAQNPLQLEPAELLKLTTRMTIVGGRIVYEAD